MQHDLQLRIEPSVAADTVRLTKIAASSLSLNSDRIKSVRIVRRSVDARQQRVMFNVTLRVWVDETPSESLLKPIDYKPVPQNAPQAVVVGAGPAGLFAALRLIELGVRPIVLERGKPVDLRAVDMARIARQGIVDPDSNYCFGEGGAGAYSDGKLFTRSKKRGPVDKILHILVQHGAKEEILVDAHPHIGTDRLPLVVKAIRETIIACGGKVIFSARVEKLLTDGTHITGAATADGTEYHGPVILATGHSARDVYALLHNAGIELQPKGIAVGVRLEHPQALIDSLQYHCRGKRSQYLPAAEYSLLTRVDGRAVYSFCMCPGGVIVAAATAPGELVVNGMSASARAGRKANSGMVVEVLPEDVPAEFEKFGPLKVMEYQRSIETAFYSDAMSYNSPAQRMTDFVAARDSKNLPESTYAPGIHAARVDLLLPAPISDRLRRGFRDFDSKRRGFLSPEATVIGAETRTSAPVRIPRDKETLQHVSVAGLYPCGEGAGYAGGIVSAAIDGDRCASALAETLKARSF